MDELKFNRRELDIIESTLSGCEECKTDEEVKNLLDKIASFLANTEE